ncbi:MAG TPA: carboxypeptidase-like regulatory domain-containing protein, partial [Terriglobia bacterium]|nr:carboxypeptidase-like regulatory domain-containing protein [Terriglobia bacterium]
MNKFALCVIISVLFASQAVAQNVNATVGGTVVDSTGAVLPGATVTITGIDTGVKTTTISNESGAYQFSSLQAGNYRVVAELPGFQEFTYERVTLDVGAQVRLNFSLSVAGAATSVEVAVAESPLLATTATVGGVINGQQILDLPLIDQSASSLALTQPQFAGGIGGGVSVAGGSTISLLTTVNGISVSNTRLDRAGGLQSFQLTQSVDLVEEVKVISSPADAESGRALGQVQMIVRSGTNQFHGSAVDGIRNTAFNANTFWNNFRGLPRQDLKRNQYAARLGGPIRKNKTFFFGLYAGNRQVSSAASTATVLTQQARAGDFRFFPGAINANANATNNPTVDVNGNPIRPATATDPLQTISVFNRDVNRPAADPTGLIQKYIGMTPLPNDFTVGDGLNTAGYTWQVPSFSNSDQYTGKVDHYLNQNHHLNVVMTYQHDSYTSTAPIYPAIKAIGVSQVHSWFASLNLASTLRTNLLNEFKAGFQHPDLDQVSGTRAYPDVYPLSNGVRFTPAFSSFTSPIPGNIDSELIDPVYTVGDTLSWTHGRHAFKMGFQADSMSSNSFNINNNYVPSVTLGAGSTAVQGISNISGLVAQNQALATSLLTDLTGSLASITQGFGVADGRSPAWIPYPNRR